MDCDMYNVAPLSLWENDIFIFVGNTCDPQDKAKPIAAFLKSNPESREFALLLRQVIYKWRQEKVQGK